MKIHVKRYLHANGSTPTELHIELNWLRNSGFFIISDLCLRAKTSNFSLKIVHFSFICGIHPLLSAEKSKL